MIYVITGPTNTGKDRIAIDLAKRIGGEIINADAFHVYRQLHIGTNKPKEEDFEGIKHHLFEIVDVDENYSIARYQKETRIIIEDLLAKNIPIIMLGGSGLYIKAALYDYHFKEEPAVDMSQYDKLENKKLHGVLKTVDLAAAETIHYNNRHRVLRALQIYHAQGIKKSDIPIKKDSVPLYKTLFFGIDFDRGDLYLRIVERVQRMINDGLFDEVKNLIHKYGNEQQAFHAIGYKEPISYLLGKITKEQAINDIITNTRHYVKRQITFVRHQFDMHWIKSVDDIIRISKNG
ncbi:MAG: tRNA (adenosine(37)-N6)-dimethylallyltransferase MiaA [Bacilli bacterium]|jgi:tRNA dimethylallyltransferase|nr:tRNA (adenosine(37)-N6)-dimethylallyltransferase MiaA [Bacilli bacterium]